MAIISRILEVCLPLFDSGLTLNMELVAVDVDAGVLSSRRLNLLFLCSCILKTGLVDEHVLLLGLLDRYLIVHLDLLLS